MADIDPKDIKEGLVLFENDFQLEPSYLEIEKTESFTYDQAYLKVMRVVEDLLARDFNALLNVLYRIDVSEEQLKKVLALGNEDPASVITDMILKRELKKVETRRKYS